MNPLTSEDGGAYTYLPIHRVYVHFHFISIHNEARHFVYNREVHFIFFAHTLYVRVYTYVHTWACTDIHTEIQREKVYLLRSSCIDTHIRRKVRKVVYSVHWMWAYWVFIQNYKNLYMNILYRKIHFCISGRQCYLLKIESFRL